jgi:AraC family transcriptional regulator of adaptative response / DNA-3-methyladenine glycosylase II
LAERLGIGERQLRRLFRQHLGASPIAVAQTRRVLFAKQLTSRSRGIAGSPATYRCTAAGFGFRNSSAKNQPEPLLSRRQWKSLGVR